MKVLMAEDLESVREHLSELLAETGDFELRFIEQDASLLMQTTAAWRPDVVVLDISMREGMALGILEALKREWQGMAVVVSAFFFQPYYRTAFLKLGADLFFDKSIEWDELIAFLRSRQAQVTSDPSIASIHKRSQGFEKKANVPEFKRDDARIELSVATMEERSRGIG